MEIGQNRDKFFAINRERRQEVDWRIQDDITKASAAAAAKQQPSLSFVFPSSKAKALLTSRSRRVPLQKEEQEKIRRLGVHRG